MDLRISKWALTHIFHHNNIKAVAVSATIMGNENWRDWQLPKHNSKFTKMQQQNFFFHFNATNIRVLTFGRWNWNPSCHQITSSDDKVGGNRGIKIGVIPLQWDKIKLPHFFLAPSVALFCWKKSMPVWLCWFLLFLLSLLAILVCPCVCPSIWKDHLSHPLPRFTTAQKTWVRVNTAKIAASCLAGYLEPLKPDEHGKDKSGKQCNRKCFFQNGQSPWKLAYFLTPWWNGRKLHDFHTRWHQKTALPLWNSQLIPERVFGHRCEAWIHLAPHVWAIGAAGLFPDE